MRAARGGEEARLFCADLLDAYRRHFKARGWKVTELDCQRDGGVRSAALLIRGSGIGGLRAEAGEHVVQRKTRSRRKDRIHTSSVFVTVLELRAPVDVDLSAVEVETFRGSGPGGQHRNVTDSAVRARDPKTGLEATLTSGRSQHDNRALALEVLAARIRERNQQAAATARNSQRRAQAKPLRTYDFVRGMIRCRDGTKSGQLKAVMSGGFELLRG
jgi:peptide chain release factor 1